MITMNSLQSWSTMLLLFAAVACLVWLLWDLDQRRIARQDLAETAAEQTAIPAETLAEVIELRPARLARDRQRHLTLIQGSGSASSEEFYDWKIDGL